MLEELIGKNVILYTECKHVTWAHFVLEDVDVENGGWMRLKGRKRPSDGVNYIGHDLLVPFAQVQALFIAEN